MNMIQLTNISKNFVLPSENVQALKNVSIAIPEKSFAIIYGPSGSGKSTLLNTLVGLEPPTTGEVKLNGTDLYSMNSDQRANFRARLVGMVYQTNYWVTSLNVVENVAMPLYLAGYSRREADKLAMESLEKINMQDFAKKQPSILSGGQQQRVSVARALVSDPSIIVADEPTGNLDTKSGDLIMNMLYELRHRMGKTVVLVTHNLSYLPLSDLRIQIKDGTTVQDEGDYGVKSDEKARILKDFQNMISANRQLAKSSAEQQQTAKGKSQLDGLSKGSKS